MNLFREGSEIERINLIFPILLIKNIKLFKHISVGWGNGYVCLPDWHPFYKTQYDEIPVNVHGGLTFSDLDDEENLWVIGFDTCHFMDNETSCTYDYVKTETFELYHQCLNINLVKRYLKLNRIKKLYN